MPTVRHDELAFQLVEHTIDVVRRTRADDESPRDPGVHIAYGHEQLGNRREHPCVREASRAIERGRDLRREPRAVIGNALQLDEDRDVGTQNRQRLVERQQPRAPSPPLAGSLGAHRHLAELVEGPLANRTAAAAHPPRVEIVVHEDALVTGKRHVELDGIDTGVERVPERRSGVLGLERGGTAMTDDAERSGIRERSGRHASAAPS